MLDDTTARGTLLHFAVQCGNALMVKLLLENKVSATMKDHSGLTPFDIATSNGNQEIIQLLRKANPQLEKNKDKTPRDIIIKTNKTPEGLVVNGNNAAAEPANVISPYLKQHDATRNDEQTSVTGESSDSTVDEQCLRVNVKSMVEKFESPQKINAICSSKQTSTSLNESSSSDDSGICTESEDGEDIDAKNEESKSHVTEYQSKLEALEKQNQKENQSLKQQIQDLESEKATLNSELEKTKTKTSEVSLGKAHKVLAELKNGVAGHETKLEALEKLNEENESLEQKIQNLESEKATLKDKLDKTESQHSNYLEENQSLKQKIQELGNENTKLKDKLDKTESQYSKAEALLEKTQKELEESKSCIARHETKLKQFNKENESLTQKIKSLENENTPLEGELGKTKTNEVSLEKVGKRQFSPKVAYASLTAMLVVGAALRACS